MLTDILNAAGIPNEESRFPDPPAVTYAVYFDDVETDGPDGRNAIYTHNYTVELYEPDLDDAAEAALEAELDAKGLHWSKQARYWLQNVQRYQVIYEFTTTTKTRR